VRPDKLLLQDILDSVTEVMANTPARRLTSMQTSSFSRTFCATFRSSVRRAGDYLSRSRTAHPSAVEKDRRDEARPGS
jgi:hypothetical protein